MRYLHLTILCLLLTNLAAQESNSPTYFNALGLDFSFQSDNGNSSLAIAPAFLRQISPRWLVGGRLRYARGATERISTLVIPQPPGTTIIGQELTFNNLGIGLIARFLVNPDDRLLIFLQPELSYAYGKTEILPITSPGNASEFFDREVSIGFSPGAKYQLDRRWRVTVGFGFWGYRLQDSKVDRDGEFENIRNSWSANLNMSSLRFGIEYLF
ncbi:MAG: hypothetical protein AAF433_08150 [Bacteroidota bacterium]